MPPGYSYKKLRHIMRHTFATNLAKAGVDLVKKNMDGTPKHQYNDEIHAPEKPI